MAQPLGPQNDPSLTGTSTRRGQRVEKKKGCRQQKCSKWKGGKCRCGRD
jgi:hypothetical protein